jgi:hypothetical protein
MEKGPFFEKVQSVEETVPQNTESAVFQFTDPVTALNLLEESKRQLKIKKLKEVLAEPHDSIIYDPNFIAIQDRHYKEW